MFRDKKAIRRLATLSDCKHHTEAEDKQITETNCLSRSCYKREHLLDTKSRTDKERRKEDEMAGRFPDRSSTLALSGRALAPRVSRSSALRAGLASQIIAWMGP